MSKLALRAQAVDITDLSLRHDLLAKNVLMTAQRNFGLDNSLLRCDPEYFPFLLPSLLSDGYAYLDWPPFFWVLAVKVRLSLSEKYIIAHAK
jgi:hypothetical protein